MPSLTLPLQIIARIAPLPDRAFFLKSIILRSVFFSSNIISLQHWSLYFLEDLISSFLKSFCTLKEGNTNKIPFGILLLTWIRNYIRSLNISALLRLRLSYVNVNFTLEAPALMTLASICSLFITCLLTNWFEKATLSSFSHVLRGFRVPEVSKIVRGLKRKMSLNVSQGTKHLSPTL